MVDIKQVEADAKKEFADEQAEAAKEKLKTLYRKKAQAEKIVQNIDREITDAIAEIGRPVS